VHDRGTAFTSLALKEYCGSHNIRHLLIATGVKREFLGLYKIVAVKDHGRYEVEHISDSERPFKMANEQSGGPNAGF